VTGRVGRPGRAARRAGGLALAALALAAPVQAQAPACAYADLAAEVRPAGDGRYSLLDTAYALPPDFVPSDLVPLRRAGFDDDRRIRAVVVPDLTALREAAEAAGVPLEVQSAYRSYAYQERTFAYWVDLQGYEAALRTSARPGHSEHQLGTAVDLRARGGPAPWDIDFGATDTGRWLLENAWRYGFALSYPQGQEARSCYAYEPWHWRWVGRELASELHRGDRVLRESLWEDR
jgi:D-alanyl-D-alanine carboxypeptidase